MRFAITISIVILVTSACGSDDQPGGVSGASNTGTSAVGAPGTGGAKSTMASNAGNSTIAGVPGGSAATAGQLNSTTKGGGGKAGNAIATGGKGGAAGAVPTGEAGSTEQEPGKKRLAVSADFVNQSLSIVDLDKLVDGATREDALVGTVDLSKYTPGPLDLAITPDGKTALVSISAGWLSAFDTTIPAGNGTVLIVDLEKKTVVKDLNTGASPMGITITKDGKRAFVGIYGSALHVENYILLVDIEKQTFEQVPTGQSYNEELAIDDTGTVAILTLGTSGNCMTFLVDDPVGKQGATIGLTSDAAGVAFFPGTKMAFLAQAPTVLTANMGGHNVINAEDPTAPVSSDNIRVANSPTWYPVTAVPNRKSVAVPAVSGGKLSLIEWKLEGDTAKQVQEVAVMDTTARVAYGAITDSNGHVLLAVPEEKKVAVVDLNTSKVFVVPWGLAKTGPTTIRLVP
jgi:hypothetical protein